MKAFAALLVSVTLLASPAMAFSVDVSIPNLTWPEEPVAPITQACADPAQLGAPDCPAPE